MSSRAEQAYEQFLKGWKTPEEKEIALKSKKRSRRPDPLAVGSLGKGPYITGDYVNSAGKPANYDKDIEGYTKADRDALGI